MEIEDKFAIIFSAFYSLALMFSPTLFYAVFLFMFAICYIALCITYRYSKEETEKEKQ